MRTTLRRYHIWLGWIVGIPLLFWTASGLFFAAVPIEKVRSETAIAEPLPLENGLAAVPPAIGPRPVASLLLEQQAGGPRWIVRYVDGEARHADARTGALLPPLSAPEATANVMARYRGEARLTGVTQTAKDAPPVELRRPVATWRVTMSDGLNLYVTRDTGEIIARRSSTWRLYDFLWGLHIMDLKTRDDFNHPLLIGFAAVSFIAVLMALVLLVLTPLRRGMRNRS